MKTLKRQADYIQLVDDWFIGTDGKNIILLKRRVITNAARANSNNLGKETFDTIGYYSSLSGLASGMLRYLSMDVLESGGASTLIDYVKKLDSKLDEIKKLDKELLRRVKEQMGVTDNE